MEFPKRIYVIQGEEAGTVLAANADFNRLPKELLGEGAEIGVYLYRRMKLVEVTRRLRAPKGEPDEPEDSMDDVDLFEEKKA